MSATAALNGPFSEQEVKTPPPDVHQGKVIAKKYQVIELLGSGGCGSVYRVAHLQMGKHMAMKMLHPEPETYAQLAKRFRIEAKAVSRLDHVNTVSVFDFDFSEDGSPYLIMEYIKGYDIGRLLQKTPSIAADRVCDIAAQVCNSLADAHSKNIIHRDLKPDNIMLVHTKDGLDFVKVLDFGLAKILEKGEVENVTQKGLLLGTPYYMSPEQIMGDQIDRRTDIYSLGAVLYHMLAGRPPFVGNSYPSVLTKHINEKVVPFHQIEGIPPVPERLEKIVLKALEKDPVKRFQSAEAFGFNIKQALGNMPSPRRSHTAMSIARRPKSESSEFVLSGKTEWLSFHRSARQRQIAKYVALVGSFSALAVAALLFFSPPALTQRDGFEREPNNNRRQASQVAYGKEVKGYIGKRISKKQSDRDWYQLPPLREGSAFLDVNISAIANLDLQLELYREGQDQALWASDHSATGGAESIHDFFIQAEHRYFLVVKDAQENQYPTENISDVYSLTITQKPFDSSCEREPNNDLADSTPIKANTHYRGWVNGDGDRDLFFLPQISHPQTYKIEVLDLEQGTTEIEVVDGNLDKIRYRSLNRVKLTPGKDYYLKLTHHDYPDKQPYRLRLTERSPATKRK